MQAYQCDEKVKSKSLIRWSDLLFWYILLSSFVFLSSLPQCLSSTSHVQGRSHSSSLSLSQETATIENAKVRPGSSKNQNSHLITYYSCEILKCRSQLQGPTTPFYPTMDEDFLSPVMYQKLPLRTWHTRTYPLELMWCKSRYYTACAPRYILLTTSATETSKMCHSFHDPGS